ILVPAPAVGRTRTGGAIRLSVARGRAGDSRAWFFLEVEASGQFDPLIVDLDQPLLVQPADGLLEVALADAEALGNQLRIALVAQRQAAAVGAQLVENLLAEAVAHLFRRRLQAQADLAVLAHFADVAGLAHAGA